MTFVLELDFATCLIAVLAIAIFYWYQSTTLHYWKKKNVPTDERRPFFGLGNLWKRKTARVLDQEQYQKHGKICGIYFRNEPMLLVADPELIKMILIKDFQNFHDRRVFPVMNEYMNAILPNLQGEEWKRMRSIVTPVFTSGKMRKLAALVNKTCKSMTESLMMSADRKTPVELKRIYGAFTLDVIASTAFGTELDAINNPDDIFVSQAWKLFAPNMNWRTLFFALAPRLLIKLKISVIDPTVTKFFAELVLEIKEKRENQGKVHEDFLQMLIDIEKETAEEKADPEENIYGAVGEVKPSSQRNLKKTLNREEFVAHCLVFFLAGFGTIGSTMSIICYSLALNPECQERLQAEVDQYWEKHEGKIDFDIVNGMKYLGAVVAETLRLYPIGTRLERKCMNDYVLGETGITIPKGMYVGIPSYAMHRDPEYFPDPLKFDPERFLPENKDAIKPYTYMPFGIGPRNCVGMRLALMEIKVGIMHIMRHVTFCKCPQTEIPLRIYPGGVNVQAKSVTVGVKRRR